MAISTEAYELLVAKIATVWSLTASTNIVRATTLNIRNIEERLREGDIVLPCAIVILWEEKEEQFGTQNNVYSTRCSAIYITGRSSDTLDGLETACEDLKTGLYGWYASSGIYSAQVKRPPRKNTDLNSFNKLCLERSNQLMGGEVEFDVIYGVIDS